MESKKEKKRHVRDVSCGLFVAGVENKEKLSLTRRKES
jgi:hypothetical protein